jgi:AcrR family transcriptional regulator
VGRRYELKARAEAQEQTRRRIVEATIQLHESLGPARTTVTAIAERAGVGRLTVYRHFPEDADLFNACSHLYWERNPAPDPELWQSVLDPVQRLKVALRETYRYHRQTEAMISKALADVGEAPHMAPYHQHWHQAADIIASGFTLQASEQRKVRAIIGLAICFGTWRSLVRDQGLSDKAAADLMTGFVIGLTS